MAIRTQTLVAAGIAGALSLTASKASATHDTALYVMILGHGTLVPAYASTIYYSVKTDRKMPVGWLLPNLALSLHGFSAGIMGLEIATDQYSIELYGPPPYAIPASLSVVAGSLITAAVSILQYTRSVPQSSGPAPRPQRGQLPVVVLPMGSQTPAQGTMVGLTAIGTF